MSRVRLGELLLTRGLCTRDQLSQAWEQKVVYGDRLGTNLLALGVIDEAALATVLGVQHGVHAGHGGVLAIDPAAIEKVPAALAVKRNVVPHHIADRTLYLLMKDPDDLRAIDDVRFLTRLKVQPVAVCEARLWRLLSEHYGQKSPLRPNPIDNVKRQPTKAVEAVKAAPVEDLVSEEEFQLLYAKLASGSAGDIEAKAETKEAKPEPQVEAPRVEAPRVEAPGVEAPRVEAPRVEAKVEAEPEPEEEEATTGFPQPDLPPGEPKSPFDDPPAPGPPVMELPSWGDVTRPIRMRLVAGTAVGPEDPEPPSESPLTSSLVALSASLSPLSAPLTAPAGAEDWQRVVEETNPMRAIPRVASLIDQMQSLEEIELVEVADADPDSVPPDAPSFFSGPGTNSVILAPPPDLSPLSFDEAVSLLKTAKGRDDIARVVLRAARARFARACLITVYPHAFVGWQGVGEGFESEKLVDIAVPRDVPSVFALVADSRAHYLGPLQRFAAHGPWVKATGKKIPKSLAVLPILVRGRVVNVLVVDNGHDQHVGSDVGGLLILAQHIAGTYEQLIQKG
ncbi:MAG: hypothetical protein Q8O67_07205 [Deltaproteobacteria bacterium]|nr:hypothetical protein [Deltaproteobacteria bacterium]